MASGLSAGPNRSSQTPLVKAWGTNGTPVWSPDGSKFAFVSNRVDHSLIGVYDMRVAPRHLSVAERRSRLQPDLVARRHAGRVHPPARNAVRPAGAPGSRQHRQSRRPGLQPADRVARRRRGPRTRWRQPRRTRSRCDAEEPPSDRPGLFDSTFTGGYTLAFYVADVATGEGKEFWHNQKNDKDFNAISAIYWGDADHVIFEAEPQEWARWYSVRVAASGPPTPMSSRRAKAPSSKSSLSPDGKFLIYATNAGDSERRHVWKVPTAGGAPEQLTQRRDHRNLSGGAARQAASRSSAAMRSARSASASCRRAAAPRNTSILRSPSFRSTPKSCRSSCMTKAADGTEIHNQLFLPKDLKPGERRPAIVFVHGGPVRQMLLGYHYMHFYHFAYGINQWLASRGYVVMSINYRSGIGYGQSFRTAPNTGGRGNSEYQDVLAGGKYLQTRADVDPNRVGIWGLSYGGVLTAQALARNSDIFKVGVDLAGVHLWGSSLDPDSVSYNRRRSARSTAGSRRCCSNRETTIATCSSRR